MADAPAFILPSGRTVKLGYKRRPFEPKSARYNFTNYLRPTVDLTQPRVFWGTKPDPRLPIKDQKNMGSCCSFGVAEAATAIQQLNIGAAVELMHDWLYEQARKKEGSFPSDAGSDPADILDLCISGAPPQSDQPGGYIDNPSATFDQFTGQATLKYIQSFHGIFPTDSPNMQTLVWQALDSGYPVSVALGWTNAMFNPVHGILPSGQTVAMEVGGHCVYCWGIVPGYYLCDNSWTASWAPDAAQSGFPGMRPGSFAIPWAYGAPGSLIEEMYVVVGSSAPTPTPTPGPTPTPTPTPTTSCRVTVDTASTSIQAGAAAQRAADHTGGNVTRSAAYDFRDAWLVYDAAVLDAAAAGNSAPAPMPIPRLR